jgi:hypothetical protein
MNGSVREKNFPLFLYRFFPKFVLNVTYLVFNVIIWLCHVNMNFIIFIGQALKWYISFRNYFRPLLAINLPDFYFVIAAISLSIYTYIIRN